MFLSSIWTDASSTPQTPDLLIVGQDTFYLEYTFPIEQLGLKISYNLFNKDGEYEIMLSSCWRSYQAIWEIENNKLYLRSMKSCHSGKTYDYPAIIDYFTKNGYKPKIENGKIFADWYTSYLIKVSEGYGFLDCSDCLEGKENLNEGQTYVYKIVNGEYIEND